MPTNLDVIKIGSRYQVVRTSDNTPMGKTYPTRKDAWDYIYELQAEEYGHEMFPSTPHTPEQYAEGTVEQTVARAQTSKGPKVGQKTNVTYGKKGVYK